MKRFIVILACCIVSAGAVAQTSVPEEIRAYKTINVSFSKGATECNLEDPAAYEERLREKLAGIGVTQSDDSILVASLGVSGQKFGLIGGHCVSLVELSFLTALSKDNIVTDNPNVRQAVDRLGVFPITLYKNGMFAVQSQSQPDAGGETTTSKEAALKMIDALVERLDSARK